MFQGRNYEQWERQCLSASLASSSLPNTTSSNTLYYVDYIAITMFTMSRRKHCVYSFCTKISAFSSPTNRTKYSDSKIITFHTNTTPHFADFAKKISPRRKFLLKIYRRIIILAFYLLYLQKNCKNKC